MEPELAKPEGQAESDVDVGYIEHFVNEVTSSPLNICLLLAIIFLLYNILRGRNDDNKDYTPPPPPLPKMKKRDFRIDELRKYDGTDESGRVLIAVNGKVFDCTRGKRFYGPGECDSKPTPRKR